MKALEQFSDCFNAFCLEGMAMSRDLAFLLRGYDLTNTARVIYGLLDGLAQASARNGKPYTYISRESIAKRVGVCEKTVRTALKQLKSVGLITEKRMGRGLNNHIFVFLPKEPQEEKQKKVETADHSIYQSRTVKNAAFNTNGKKVIENYIDKSIYPHNDTDNAPTAQNKGITAPKGRPTKKQTKRTIEERRQIKKRYKEYLIKKLELEEFKNDLLSYGDDIEALEKIIELMSNTMAAKGKIMVNGALMMPAQWWYVAKNLTQDSAINVIVKVGRTPNIKNYRAYMLSSIYNAALTETLEAPAYNRLMESVS